MWFFAPIIYNHDARLILQRVQTKKSKLMSRMHMNQTAKQFNLVFIQLRVNEDLPWEEGTREEYNIIPMNASDHNNVKSMHK